MGVRASTRPMKNSIFYCLLVPALFLASSAFAEVLENGCQLDENYHSVRYHKVSSQDNFGVAHTVYWSKSAEKNGRGVYSDLGGVDENGLIVNNHTASQATYACESKGMRLPTKDEFDALLGCFEADKDMHDGNRFLSDKGMKDLTDAKRFPDIKNRWFWSSSVVVSPGAYDAYALNGINGNVSKLNRGFPDSVLCVMRSNAVKPQTDPAHESSASPDHHQLQNQMRAKIDEYKAFVQDYLRDEASPADLTILSTNDSACGVSSGRWLEILQANNFPTKIAGNIAHAHVIDDSLGEGNEIIIDGTYRQFLDMRTRHEITITREEAQRRTDAAGIPRVFVGTRDELVRLFKMAPGFAATKDHYVDGKLINGLWMDGNYSYQRVNLDQTVRDYIRYSYYENLDITSEPPPHLN